MVEKIIFEDVLLDNEPVGLAEGFVAVTAPFITVIGTDEPPEPDATVYFGIELAAGDIGEVKGHVVSCEESGANYRVVIQVLALDNRFPDLLAKALRGEDEKNGTGEGGPLWGLGLKQTNGAMATLVNCPAGLLSGAQLAKLAEITQKGHGLAKLTHAQRIVLLLRPEQVESVRRELDEVGLRIGVLHTGIRNIRGCCGALCQFAQGTDGLGLALEIDRALYGRTMKFDVKIAVSDCLRNCMESFCVDIGLIAHGGRYDFQVGGVASTVHLRGITLTTGVAPGGVVDLITRILAWYEERAKQGERLHKTLERLGAAERPTAREGLVSGEPGKAEDPAFAEAAALFSDIGMAKTIHDYLTRSYSRGVAVARLRADLGLA